MPKNPDRIDPLLNVLKTVMKSYPDIRLGQLMVNLTRTGEDLFYMEDNKLVERLQLFLSKGSAQE